MLITWNIIFSFFKLKLNRGGEGGTFLVFAKCVCVWGGGGGGGVHYHGYESILYCNQIK